MTLVAAIMSVVIVTVMPVPDYNHLAMGGRCQWRGDNECEKETEDDLFHDSLDVPLVQAGCPHDAGKR